MKQELDDYSKVKEKAPQIVHHFNNILERYVERADIPLGLNDTYRYYYSTFHRSFEHLFSLPIPKIQDFRPVHENPTSLMKRLGMFEEEWQKTRKGLIPYDSDGRILLRFPKDLVWMQLDRAACDKEGNAMGHCGNLPSQQKGDTILSLRQLVKKGNGRFWKPYLTFILDKDGYLGEMKGRFNLKPSKAHREGHAPSDFHDEIEALLRLPIIRGIKGGGYAPKQNFSLDDLEKDRRDKLLSDHPHLKLPPKQS